MTNKHPKNKNNGQSYIISYLTLRKAVGILGISLPFILIIGNILLDGEIEIMNSISTYSHTRMGNGFVGILCAIALFLFSYTGHDNIDNISGHLACIFALGIAFLPNSPTNPDTIINKLHFVSACLFFLVLIYFSLILFTKSDKPKPYSIPKKKRNRVYYICGFTMLGSLLFIALYMLWLKKSFPSLENFKPVFWLESLALFAFGISWLTKGQIIFKDLKVDKTN